MSVKKAKQKQWHTIVAPKLFDEVEIGKTFSIEPKNLIGRRITVSAIDLTGNFSKYYLKFIFRISEMNGEKALTTLDGTEILGDYISRMILRRVRRIDTIQDLKTKDGIILRVKALTVIGRRVKSSIQKQVSEKVKELIVGAITESTLEEIVEKMLNDEMKNRILQEASRIYPLRNFEFRKIEVLKQ